MHTKIKWLKLVSQVAVCYLISLLRSLTLTTAQKSPPPPTILISVGMQVVSTPQYQADRS